MSISSDTLVEETTQDTQIQVVCQTSQGQNLPGIGQTLEEYWSFAGQIPSSLSLPAEHARSLFPPANAGASQASSYSQRKAARGNWGGFCAHPVHIHDNSSSEQGNSLFHTVHSQEIHVQPYTSTAAKVRHCPSCNNHFKHLDILHTARIRAGKNLICTKSICIQATVSTWKQQAEEPPWLASRNPSGSLTLSEFSRHGKPSICVSPVPTQNATGIQWEAERKGEKKKTTNLLQRLLQSPSDNTHYQGKGLLPREQNSPSKALLITNPSHSQLQKAAAPAAALLKLQALNTTGNSLIEHRAHLSKGLLPR